MKYKIFHSKPLGEIPQIRVRQYPGPMIDMFTGAIITTVFLRAWAKRKLNGFYEITMTEWEIK